MQHIWCGHFLNAWAFGGDLCDVNAALQCIPARSAGINYTIPQPSLDPPLQLPRGLQTPLLLFRHVPQITYIYILS